MNKILLYLFESGICLLVFYLLYALLLKRETSFLYNRFYLLITPLLSFTIPLIELPFLQQPEPLTIFVAEQLTPITITVTATTPTPEAFLFNWQTGCLLLYALGFTFFTFRLIRQLYQLHCFTRQTQADFFYWENIPVHKTNGVQPTFSFGKRIFWDNSQPLTTSESDRVFLHEAIHIRQKHSWDILYLEVLRVIFWFNPLLYFYQKALTATHEFIADATVLRTTKPDTYASLLAKQVLHRLEFSYGNYFNKSLTLKRMNMIKQANRRPNKLKPFLALPVLTFLVFMLSSGSTPVSKIMEEPTTIIPNFLEDSTTNSESNSLNAKNSNLTEPVYPGGKQALYAFLSKNLKFPVEARNPKDMASNAFIALKIDKNGFINFKEFSDNANSSPFDKEIDRVLRQLPSKWLPAIQNGKPIASRYILSFSFIKRNPADRLLKSIKEEPDTSFAGDSERSPAFAGQTVEVIYYDKNIPISQSNSEEKSIKQQNIKVKNISEPQFPGGTEALNQFLRANIVYPELAQKEKKQGEASILTLIDKLGNIRPILTPANNPFSESLLNLVAKMPRWEPATQNRKAIDAQYLFRFNFVLNNSAPKSNKNLPTGLLRASGSEEPFFVANEVMVIGNPLPGQTGLYKTKVNDQKASKINPDEVFTFVEQTPNFPGGTDKMFAFFSQNIKYPEAAKYAGLQGNVIAQFIVTKTGKITDIIIVKSLSPETDAEAKRVISLMPNWEPGKQYGKPLNVKYTLPIRFAFDGGNAIKTSNQLTSQDNTKKPIFTQVEQNPQFSGGVEKMYQFLGSNIKYPKAAVKANLQGMVVTKFLVTKEGKIKDVKIVNSLSPETDAEAKRVISLMPTWEPGKQNGNPVNVEYTLPIQFSLDAGESKKPAKPLKTGFYWNKNQIKWIWYTPSQNNC